MKLIFLTVLLFVVTLTQKPPVWPVRFQQEFIQSWASTKTQDIGRYWYDSEKEMSRVDRNNGQYDPFCNSVVDGKTPCIHIVREKKRYLYFPAIRLCCYCCDSSQGCGILKRDWTQTLTFAGIDELDGKFFNKYTKEGEGVQYWTTTEATDARQIPRKLVEEKMIFKDFILNEYTEKEIPLSVFNLPPFCAGSVCPASSECGKLRGETL